MTDRVGQQLGNYRLIRMIGRGGFADVYLGEHVYLNTQAAIKVLHAQLASDTMDKFLSEAQIVARLSHPYIVRVLDFGVHNYTPFLAMEYAPNGTLRQRHPRGIQLPLPIIVSYIRQIGAALQYAHDQRLIHRDIKPENMLVGRNNEILLSDFGIATISQTSRSLPTQDISGTVSYMAPEQIQGKARPASDQYSLAIITYEWLTGVCPFQGSFFEVATQHMLAPPPPLRDKVPNISRDVEQVLLMALAKEPEKRFMRVEAFATALEQASQFKMVALADASPNATFFIPPSNPATMMVMPPGITPSTSEPTQLATPASFAPFNAGSQTTPAPSFSTPPSALPNLPGITPSREEQAQRRRGISRRGVVVGLVGLAAVLGSGATYLVLSRELFGPTKARGSTSTPTATSAPTSTPAPTPTSKATAASSPTAAAPTAVTLQVYAGPSQMYSVAWQPRGSRIASAGQGQTIQIWDPSTGHVFVTCNGTSAKVFSVSWSPDGIHLVSGDLNGNVQIWDAASGNPISTLTGHSGQVNSVAWSPDNTRIVSGGGDKTARVWDVASGNTIQIYTGHTHYLNAVAWSHDSARIVSGSGDHTAQVWDPTTGNTLQTYSQHTHEVLSLAWSPDNSRIASASDDATVQVWDASTASRYFTYSGHSDFVVAVAWSPQSNRIVSGSKDTTVQVWDANNGHPIYTYRGHSAEVEGVAWAFDSNRIASASDDTTVHVWEVT